MRSLGARSVPVAELRTSANLNRRRALPRIRTLAWSLKQHGQLTPILVDQNMVVLDGIDRWVAAILAGVTELVAHVVDVDEHEALYMADLANGARRHDPSERSARLEAAIKALEETLPDPATKRGKGRPRTKRGDAIRMLAEERGVRAETIWRQISMARRRGIDGLPPEDEDSEALSRLVTEWTPETWGRDVEPEDLHIAREVRRRLLRMRRSATTLLQTLGRTRTEIPFLDTPRFEEAARVGKELADRIHAIVPHALCCYCKNLPAVRRQCRWCEGSGWMGRPDAEEAPAEVRRTETVVFSGRVRSAADFEGQP